MSNVTYTVQRGDTLSEIAFDRGTTVQALLRLNPDITNPDRIYVGQVIIISGAPSVKTVSKSQKAKITNFGLQANTDRTVFATWAWDKANTSGYEIRWKYGTGDGVAFIGTDKTVTDKQDIYNAPANATSVLFYVRPISRTYKSGNKDVKYWTADWSVVSRYYFSSNPPVVPPVPTVTVSDVDYKLTASVSGIGSDTSEIHFQVVKNNLTTVKNGTAKVASGTASCTCTVEPGGDYKVRCRGLKNGLYSAWSEYSSNYSTIPSVVSGISSISVLSKIGNSFVIRIEWYDVENVTKYEIQRTTVRSYFDTNPSGVQSVTIETIDTAEIPNIEGGQEWFFRVRAINSSNQNGPWSEVQSIVIGNAPTAPTTWSSTTSTIVGDPLYLYWVHNSADGSSQTYGQVKITVNGTPTIYTIQNLAPEEERDNTSSYLVDTTSYPVGAQITWSVRTAGLMEDIEGEPLYGAWSIERSIDVYARPTITLYVTDANNIALGNSTSTNPQGAMVETTLNSFPIMITANANPRTQIPIGYYISVKSESYYETVDSIGNPKIVNEGEIIYRNYFDTDSYLFTRQLSAGDLDLENNIQYTISCIVSMDSGLSAEATSEFTVEWTDDEYWPEAEIGYNPNDFTTFIRPYCEDENGNLLNGVTLSVYRREFNGTFTELGSGIPNSRSTFIPDPHPSLDFARYRIVAIVSATGAVSFYDIPGFPINEKAVIIQWDEHLSNFDVDDNEDSLDSPYWSGSLLRLPYNIDVSDSHEKDVSLIEYVGRERPVSYYGTQLGHTATWNIEIEKTDSDTLYTLRRLSSWMGNVYVREPSGSGYWANISVSFSQRHTELTIPVTLDITEVEGGM